MSRNELIQLVYSPTVLFFFHSAYTPKERLKNGSVEQKWRSTKKKVLAIVAMIMTHLRITEYIINILGVVVVVINKG